jgi:hypothetical protein
LKNWQNRLDHNADYLNIHAHKQRHFEYKTRMAGAHHSGNAQQPHSGH